MRLHSAYQGHCQLSLEATLHGHKAERFRQTEGVCVVVFNFHTVTSGTWGKRSEWTRYSYNKTPEQWEWRRGTCVHVSLITSFEGMAVPLSVSESHCLHDLRGFSHHGHVWAPKTSWENLSWHALCKANKIKWNKYQTSTGYKWPWFRCESKMKPKS